MKLLVDIGNTRVKWATFQKGRLRAGIPFARHLESLGSDLDKAWGGLQPPGRVMVANVAGPGMEQALAAWIRKKWGLTPFFVAAVAEALGVKSGYSEPARLGVDRWLALIAVRHHFRLPACVVDCGTAITLDVLNADGVHQGGLIIPGLYLMQEVLLRQTAGITEGPSGDSRLLGLDTGAAIRNGPLLAASGLVDGTMDRLTDHSDGKLSLVFTGGDAERVASRVRRPVRIVSDLILQGLALVP